MRCATLYISFWIAGLVGAEFANSHNSIHPLIVRNIQKRTESGRKRPQEPPGSRSPSPNQPPAQKHSPDRPSRWTTTPSNSPEHAQPHSASRDRPPGLESNKSRSPSPQRHVPDAESPRSTLRLGQDTAGPSRRVPSGGPTPAAPARIRTNPAHPRQGSSEGAALRGGNGLQQSPGAGSGSNLLEQAPPRSARPFLRAQRQQTVNDESIAKASGTVYDGRGSVMTSRLGPYGPSHLTADHSVGSFSKLAASHYHASVLATNNLNTGRMSARASGNLLVKGRIDSLDPNGLGILRTAVPGGSEVKTELHGVGHIAAEAANHNPNSGHARVQADFSGYGFVEAAATQDAQRPGMAAYHNQQAAQRNPVRSPIARDRPSVARDQEMRDASEPASQDTPGPTEQRRSGRRRQNPKHG